MWGGLPRDTLKSWIVGKGMLKDYDCAGWEEGENINHLDKVINMELIGKGLIELIVCAEEDYPNAVIEEGTD